MPITIQIFQIRSLERNDGPSEEEIMRKAIPKPDEMLIFAIRNRRKSILKNWFGNHAKVGK